MSLRKPILTVIIYILLKTFAWGSPIDDKSLDQPLLASEKRRVELLLKKASYFASIKSDK
jgi:hypothetical protein